ncbi:hypothetical protein MNBD_PLANCTO02-39, partial [hydrothermal vent metagenome]
GMIFGGVNWLYYASAGVTAPTGTVVISALVITVAFHLLLSATSEDLRSVPEKPLSSTPLLFDQEINSPDDFLRKPK